MSRLSKHAITIFFHHHFTRHPGGETDRRRLRVLILSQRFASALRDFQRLSVLISDNGLLGVCFRFSEKWWQPEIIQYANFGPANAERFIRLLCTLLKLAFGNNTAERKIKKIVLTTHSFNSISNLKKTQQLLQLMMAIRETGVPVELDIMQWSDRVVTTKIMWMAVDVLGNRLKKVSGSYENASLLQNFASPLAKVKISQIPETANSTPMSSILKIPSRKIIISGQLSSLIGDRGYEPNPTLKLLTFDLSIDDLMEKWNFHEEFKVLRSLGSQLEVAISADDLDDYDDDDDQDFIYDFSLSVKRSLMAQLEQRLSRFRHIVDTANECGVTLRSLRLYKSHSYSEGLARKVRAFYRRQYGYTCQLNEGMAFARYKTEYRRVEFEITDNFSDTLE